MQTLRITYRQRVRPVGEDEMGLAEKLAAGVGVRWQACAQVQSVSGEGYFIGRFFDG